MERITLNMVPTGVLEICHASQYDIGREIRFDLINGTDDFVLSGEEDITIFIRDFDGNLIESSAPNTSSNYVVWTSSEGELDVSGPAICELRVTKDDDVLGSANFIMEIEADAYDGAGVHVETVGPADICTFETTLPEPLQSVIVDVEATGGNGTPDSPIPINGYTEANITRCGVNLWELSEDTKHDIQGCAVDYINNGIKISANNTYARTSYVYKVKAGQTYTLSYYGYGTGNFIQIYYNDAIAWNPQNYSRQQITSTRTKYTKTFTATSDIFFVGFYVTTSGTSGDMVIEDFMLEVGSSASDDFHPYNGQIYTIAFGQTVYGGVLDVTRGKLKPCIEYPSYNGETLSGRWLSSEATYIEGTTPPTGSQVVSLDDYGSDIDLTPEVISAVVGTNNVFADCGQTTVKYLKAGA